MVSGIRNAICLNLGRKVEKKLIGEYIPRTKRLDFQVPRYHEEILETEGPDLCSLAFRTDCRETSSPDQQSNSNN